MKSPLARFTAKVDAGVLTLHVYDIIGADFFGDGVTAKAIAEKLDNSTFSSITMRINSPGGDPFEAIAILNKLKSTGKPINVIVDGLAASAASILAMAGDRVVMGQGSMFMIHNAMTMSFGNASDMRKMADTLDAVSGSMRDVYVNRTGLKADKVQAMMDAETWLTAAESVSNHFADEVISEENPEAKAVAASFDLSVFKNPPKVEPPAEEEYDYSAMRAKLALL